MGNLENGNHGDGDDASLLEKKEEMLKLCSELIVAREQREASDADGKQIVKWLFEILTLHEVVDFAEVHFVNFADLPLEKEVSERFAFLYQRFVQAKSGEALGDEHEVGDVKEGVEWDNGVYLSALALEFGKLGKGNVVLNDERMLQLKGVLRVGAVNEVLEAIYRQRREKEEVLSPKKLADIYGDERGLGRQLQDTFSKFKEKDLMKYGEDIELMIEPLIDGIINHLMMVSLEKSVFLNYSDFENEDLEDKAVCFGDLPGVRMLLDMPLYYESIISKLKARSEDELFDKERRSQLVDLQSIIEGKLVELKAYMSAVMEDLLGQVVDIERNKAGQKVSDVLEE